MNKLVIDPLKGADVLEKIEFLHSMIDTNLDKPGVWVPGCVIDAADDVQDAYVDMIANSVQVRNIKNRAVALPEITKVIFNEPATIVFWEDYTKTVVKCGPEDKFDKEKGLAMAIIKKQLYDNKGRYYELFKKWIPKEEPDKGKEEENEKTVTIN